MREFYYNLFADYYQFYLQDDDMSKGDLSDAWTSDATDALLAVAPHVIGVGTARNMTVPVSVMLCESRPNISYNDWDYVTTASLVIETGRIVVAGCTDYFPEAARIEVLPGTYEVIVCYGNLEDLSEDGLDGKDSYHLFVYPGHPIPPAILKNRNQEGEDGGGNRHSPVPHL